LNGERVVFRNPMVTELESFSLPTTPLSDFEIVVKTRVTLISPGTELARLQGKLMFDSDVPPPFPMEIVGYANIGIVLEAGEKTGVKPGDRVYTMANHATVARVDVRDALCVPVPDGLSDEEAVFVRLATVSMTTLVTTFAKAGDEIAVLGLGLVGNLAAQVFQASGMKVNAFDLSPHRREIAAQSGIGSVHGADAFPSFGQRHKLVIEATGSAKAQVSAVEITAPGGEIVMIGAPWGGDANSVPSSQLTRLIFFRFLRLRSGSEWEIPRQPDFFALGSIHHNSVTALNWLAKGDLNVKPIITHRIKPAEVAAAYDGLLNRPNDYLGVIIEWDTSN
jgi:2-desacetyl-2-hydroxyethyl bacteriochlorophyllide A dehydrogenase